MNTMLPSGEPPAGQEPFGETLEGREFPDRSAVIICSPLDYLALGTLIAAVRGFVGDVFVVCEQEDTRVSDLAYSLGARVIGPGSEHMLDVVMASCGAIVAMCGDGTHDPRLVPGLLHRVRTGYDVAASVSSPGRASGRSDAGTGNDTTGFVAASSQVARKLKPARGSELGCRLLEYAQGTGLSVWLQDPGISLLHRYRIGVVVPAYNEEVLIKETLKGMPGYISRIYVVDDGSTDRTSGAVADIADRRIELIRHGSNRGVGAAIVTGYRKALADGMDIAVVMAGDNQMDPAELPELLLPIVEGKADYSKGNRLASRESRRGMSAWRSFGNFLLTVITKIGSGYWDIMDPQNGYTAISRKAMESLDLDAVYTYYGYCNDLLIRLNALEMSVTDVAMPARYGQEKSKIRYGRFIRKVAPMIFRGFLWRLKARYITPDFHPLVLFYATGMVLAPAGLLLSLLVPLAMYLNPGIGAAYLVLAVVLALAGVESLFVAMVLDRRELPGKRATAV